MPLSSKVLKCSTTMKNKFILMSRRSPSYWRRRLAFTAHGMPSIISGQVLFEQICGVP